MKQFGTTRLLRSLAGPIAVSVAMAGSSFADDLDEDGIDDRLEAQLIDQFRPHLFFDTAEDMWPSSLTWLVQNSKMVWWEIFQPPELIYSQAQLAANPSLILGACHGGVASSALKYTDEFENHGFRLSLGAEVDCDIDAVFQGQGPRCNSQGVNCNPDFCVQNAVGMYAHVVPCVPSDEPLMYPSDTNQIQVDSNHVLIQYWQFFPFNDSQAPCDYGDHSSDWVWIDLYVDRAPPHAIRYVVYHHHGSKCSPIVCPNEYPIILTGEGGPAVFVEESSHELWPWASGGGECEFGPFAYPNEDHDGLGCNYRAENVLNVGERFAPMPNLEARMFLWFNGRFGEWWSEDIGHDSFPAKSPPYQFFPSAYGKQLGSSLANWNVPIVYAYFDAVALPWDAQVGHGSRYHPYTSIAQAAEVVVDNGVLRVARDVPITQPVTIGIDDKGMPKAMTIEAFDPVTLPQCP